MNKTHYTLMMFDTINTNLETSADLSNSYRGKCFVLHNFKDLKVQSLNTCLTVFLIGMRMQLSRPWGNEPCIAIGCLENNCLIERY